MELEQFSSFTVSNDVYFGQTNQALYDAVQPTGVVRKCRLKVRTEAKGS